MGTIMYEHVKPHAVTHSYIYIYIYIYTYIYIYACTRAHMHMCMFAEVFVYHTVALVIHW